MTSNASARPPLNSASAAIRVGIVGLGAMGTAHAKRITQNEIPGLQLAGVCDGSAQRLAEWATFPGVAICSDYAALLAADLDAIIIATPHISHAKLGIQALEAGHHVLVEKPIAVHKADAERLIAAHQNKKQVFAAMFNQRTDPNYRRLKALIDAGELGTVHRVTWIITDWFRSQFYYDSGGWRATWAGEGGGVLINQCPHQLDLYQWLFGMPQRVHARCQIGRFHDIEVEDAVTALFEHNSGLLSTLTATTGEAPGTNRLEVAGDLGQVIIDQAIFRFTRNNVSSTEFIHTSKHSFNRPDTKTTTHPLEGPGEQHVGILKNFAAACLRGEPVIAPAAEGLRSLELANAMLLSSARDTTLTLPLDANDYAAWLNQKIAASPTQRA